MKEETINQKCSIEVLNILRKYKRTPNQVRYIFKKVREDGKYKTGMRVYAWFVWINSSWCTKQKPTIQWIDNDKYVLRKNK